MDSNNVVEPNVEGCPCKSADLTLLNEVRKIYEDRLDNIERCNCDNKEKFQVHILKKWVNDLLEQNKLLVRAVQDLESDAAHTLNELKDKQLECYVLMTAWSRSTSDVSQLVELFRRVREQDSTTPTKINFFDVTEEDIYGNKPQERGDDVSYILKYKKPSCHNIRKYKK